MRAKIVCVGVYVCVGIFIHFVIAGKEVLQYNVLHVSNIGVLKKKGRGPKWSKN
jgi:hypothetical protein